MRQRDRLGAQRDDGLRRLSTLTWRASLLSVVGLVGFMNLFHSSAAPAAAPAATPAPDPSATPPPPPPPPLPPGHGRPLPGAPRERVRQAPGGCPAQARSEQPCRGAAKPGPHADQVAEPARAEPDARPRPLDDQRLRRRRLTPAPARPGCSRHRPLSLP